MTAPDPIITKLRNTGISLNPPASLHEVKEFEANAAVRLPEEYREFLSTVANGASRGGLLLGLGGWCSHYYSDAPQPAWAGLPCLLTPDMEKEEDDGWLIKAGGPDWEEKFERGLWDPMCGTIAIAAFGCGIHDALILTGPYRGSIFSWGDFFLRPPVFIGPSGFLKWLDEALEAAKVAWTLP
jgi:hypothetical protein